MPRSRGSDIPQRQSPQGPPSLRTSSSDSDQLHPRPIANRSPKLGDRRSPRGTQSDPLNQKKLGTRIADLESQLGQAQQELKTLKEQLASAEAARRQAQEELEKKKKKKKNGPALTEPGTFQEKSPSSNVQVANDIAPQDYADDNQTETDVFEVPIEKIAVECNKVGNEVEKEIKPSDLSNSATIQVPEKQSLDVESENDERNMLKSKLEEKEKELKLIGKGKENLKNQLDEAVSKLSSAQTKEQEMASKLIQLEEELKTSKINAAEMTEKFQTIEGAKEALESEMKKIRVQTEQWKKAADAAAAVLAGDVDMNGRISERCGSMDKHFGNMFVQSTGGYAGFVGSPGIVDDLDNVYASGKRKGTRIRMFGELWKKRGSK